MKYKPYDEDWFIKQQLKPPDAVTHGTDEEIREKLKTLKTWNWKLQGNQLTCQTEMGQLTQTVPTDVILVGEDEKGLPILKKIVV